MSYSQASIIRDYTQAGATSAPWPRKGVYKLPDGSWMVPSRTTAPGAYWLVRWGHSTTVTYRGDARTETPRSYFTCTCPQGQARGNMDGHNPCRHVRLAAEAEQADGYPPRPAGRVDAGMFS
jgi:hypothetical protein